MHDLHLRDEARSRRARGQSTAHVAREMNLPWSTVRRWVTVRTPTDTVQPRRCWVHDGERPGADLARRYAYLLGQYLGDGHLVTRARVPVLRIYCCTDYPAITDEVVAAIGDVRGSGPGIIRASHTERMVKVQSYWNHWPCLFPQHGPGMKHTRPIVLTDWQRVVVDNDPWPLIRGLIHSDGCRAVNRIVARGVTYRYPRYFLSNKSRDILAIMGDALDRVGVAWRYNRPDSISIAKRDAVALMDEHVGPKT